MTDAGWMSKGTYGVAHYVTAGAAVCSTAGRVIVAPTTQWRPLRPRDHLCVACRRFRPTPCRCGTCSVRPLDPAHAPRAPLTRRYRKAERGPQPPPWRVAKTWGVWCIVPEDDTASGWLNDGDPEVACAMTERAAKSTAAGRNRAWRDMTMRFEARPLPRAQRRA